ncbi:MAG: MBL fold metallo-hydrolase [Proteobacteria bacterium]|nr:MBL fold metallo-hydrolase [Pseudomonadota bacterium]
MSAVNLLPLDRVEIITLTDNYIDLAAGGNTDVVKRGRPAGASALSGSILAEHGFSAMIRTEEKHEKHTLLLDFGLSEDVAARNAKTLGIDLSEIEEAVLSHGHKDHFGGVLQLGKSIRKKNIPLTAHPSAFKPNRFIALKPGMKVSMPSPEETRFSEAGFSVIKTDQPKTLLKDHVLFLGEIPRQTPFEKGMPNAIFEQDGKETHDPLEDDTALVIHVKGKGLIIVSGCAHAGIVNTVRHAQRVTGISNVHAVMGGFHLTGPVFEPIIDETVAALKAIKPDYIIPTHCTGRKAIQAIESIMPEAFILNMAGTTLIFSTP